LERAAEDLAEYLKSRRVMVDQTMERFLPPADTEPAVIHDAIRYAILGVGKRIRPILAIAAAEACGANPEPLLRALCSLELIHTYSLVHDDLPAIDNDDLRRGRKTVHVVYGEAIAILVGDALLTEAFAWLTEPIVHVDPRTQLRGARVVAEAANSRGMIGGQVADIAAEQLQHGGATSDHLLKKVQFIHQNKTGKLITASVLLGGILAGATVDQELHLDRFGRSIGLAFQIVDDLLDQEESAQTLGKTAGKDLAQGKLTWPAVVGPGPARQQATQLLEAAIESADIIGGPRNYLAAIARYICARRS
jgi:geranylgeranyl diphosphate synthase, type II